MAWLAHWWRTIWTGPEAGETARDRDALRERTQMIGTKTAHNLEEAHTIHDRLHDQTRRPNPVEAAYLRRRTGATDHG